MRDFNENQPNVPEIFKGQPLTPRPIQPEYEAPILPGGELPDQAPSSPEAPSIHPGSGSLGEVSLRHYQSEPDPVLHILPESPEPIKESPEANPAKPESQKEPAIVETTTPNTPVVRNASIEKPKDTPPANNQVDTSRPAPTPPPSETAPTKATPEHKDTPPYKKEDTPSKPPEKKPIPTKEVALVEKTGSKHEQDRTERPSDARDTKTTPKGEIWHPDLLDNVLVKTFIDKSTPPEGIELRETDQAIMNAARELLHEAISENATELSSTLPPGTPDADTVAENLKQQATIANLLAAAAHLEGRGPRGEKEGLWSKGTGFLKDKLTPQAIVDQRHDQSLAHLRQITNRLIRKEFSGLRFNKGTAAAVVLQSMALERLSKILPSPQELANLPADKSPEHAEITWATLRTLSNTWGNISKAWDSDRENMDVIPSQIRTLVLQGIPNIPPEARRINKLVDPDKQRAAYPHALRKAIVATVANHGMAERIRHTKDRKRANLPTPGELLGSKQRVELKLSREYNTKDGYFSTPPKQITNSIAKAMVLLQRPEDGEQAKAAKLPEKKEAESRLKVVTADGQRAIDVVLSSTAALFERSAFDKAAGDEFRTVWKASSGELITILYEKYADKANYMHERYASVPPLPFSPGDALLIDGLKLTANQSEDRRKQITFLKGALLTSAYNNFGHSPTVTDETVSNDGKGKAKKVAIPIHNKATQNAVVAAYIYGLEQKGTQNQPISRELFDARTTRFLNMVNRPRVVRHSLYKPIQQGITNLENRIR